MDSFFNSRVRTNEEGQGINKFVGTKAKTIYRRRIMANKINSQTVGVRATTLRIPGDLKRRIYTLRAAGFDITLQSIAIEGIEAGIERLERMLEATKATEKWGKP